MKPLKIGLRVWIAISSLAAFLSGWVFLSHSKKPAPLAQNSSNSSANTSAAGSQYQTPLPTLQPLPSLDQLTNNSSSMQVQPLPPPSSFFSTSPRLRTRGS